MSHWIFSERDAVVSESCSFVWDNAWRWPQGRPRSPIFVAIESTYMRLQLVNNTNSASRTVSELSRRIMRMIKLWLRQGCLYLTPSFGWTIPGLRNLASPISLYRVLHNKFRRSGVDHQFDAQQWQASNHARKKTIYAFILRQMRTVVYKGKGKETYSSLQAKPAISATGTHIPYRIKHCYLPPDRGDIPAVTPAEARRDARLSWPRWLVRDALPVTGNPVTHHELTGPDVD